MQVMNDGTEEKELASYNQQKHARWLNSTE